jgi:hypothetical protein
VKRGKIVKNFMYGFITCLILVMLCFSFPIAAENFEVILGGIRINIDGVDRAQWDENIKLADGRSAPYSISYNDTTYLSLRKISELLNKTVYWNGVSNTASITDRPVYSSINEIIKKPDASGNIWLYYTFATNNGARYLGIKDEARGYERVYKIVGSNVKATEKDSLCVKADDDGIYFVKIFPRTGNEPYTTSKLYKISFLSDGNNQDGEKAFDIWDRDKFSVMFIDDCLYYLSSSSGSIGSTPILNLASLSNQTVDELVVQNSNSVGIEYIKTELDGRIYLYYYREVAAHIYKCRVEAINGNEEVHWGEPELLETIERGAQ